MHKVGIGGIFVLQKMEDEFKIVVSEVSQWQICNCIRIYLVMNWFGYEI